MKTVLIVEDEKLIRQGLKTMIMRSGVPVETVIECSNGEMALEILREQEIEVMFTDIRMPKMDGIELVQKMQSFEHVPLTVAVSGYDDFTYAVEMMRNGVREYLLKPIERDKIKEILFKLNEEIENRKEDEINQQKIGYQQIKHFLLMDSVSQDEIDAYEKNYGQHFYCGTYYVCCTNHRKRQGAVRENVIVLDNVRENDIYIVPEQQLETLLGEELSDSYAGISSGHQGLGELKRAYEEAAEMRRIAFTRNLGEVHFDTFSESIPEGLIEEAAKLTENAAKIRRVQLIGTEHTEELEKSFYQFFYEVKHGRIAEKEFEVCMQEFLEEIEKVYRKVIESESGLLNECKNIMKENCMDDYEEKVMELVLSIHEKVNHQFDQNKNQAKMRQAVEYIKENYAKDLNMAVVSNDLSMNYSLFSYSFKEYTGCNFVNYLKEIRMKEAKRLLADTDLKIIEISQKVGYDNEKHFMKMFKATCGVSPTEYRNNIRLSGR